MNEHTEKQLSRFMSILIAMGLTKEEVIGIASMMETEELATAVLEALHQKEFKTSHQETLNIIGRVIKEYQEKQKA